MATKDYINKITCGDCLELMKNMEDKSVDLVLTDPPYGINVANVMSKKAGQQYGKAAAAKKFYMAGDWDKEIPDKVYFDEIFRISKNQIIWGGNYFINDLHNTKTVIVWDKRIAEGLNNYSMIEVAWTSFDKIPSKLYSKSSTNLHRIHPTQKPIELYKWQLHHYAKAGDKILDTHVGSASSLIACIDYGFDFIGFEIDKDYYEAAQRRIDDFKAQGKLF